MGDEELFDGIDGDEGEAWYTLSDKGLEEIANWCRLHLELGKMLPEQFAGTDEEMVPEYRTALLVWFILREAYESRGMEMPGVEQGHLFPKAWEEEGFEPQDPAE